jgi:YVTN family beta-propeller protein
MNKISRLWALVITISVLALGAVVANSNSPSSAEGGCAGKAYVTNQNANTVSVIDTATNAVVGSAIPVGDQPVGIAITPDGTKAYVVNFNADTVSVIDTATNAVVGSAIPVGDLPFGIAICPAAVVPPTTPTDPAVVLKFTG